MRDPSDLTSRAQYSRRVTSARQRAAWISEQIELADAEMAELGSVSHTGEAARRLYGVATRLGWISVAQTELDGELDDLRSLPSEG